MKNIKKTILIVDDTETNIDILLELLGDTYDIVVAIDGKSALETVEENSIELILLDVMMPEMDGYQVCDILKKKEHTKNIPIIFITAKTDEESIDKAYEAGGIDYVAKPFKSRELLARVRTQIKVKELIDHLDYISSHDEMTGIYNRRKFFELGQKKFAQSSDILYGVMIDIDDFKRINDTYGHATGDEVIRLITKTIAEYLPKGSIFGRLGGEEFAVICSFASLKDVQENTQTIRQAVENLEVLSDDAKKIKFTISGGIAKATRDTKGLDELLKEADIAMYEAKSLGRNRIVFFEDDSSKAVSYEV
jgi:diguanylate cyclase (GGDEF)-like protein